MEWDMFGMETSYYPPNPKTHQMPNDAVRLQFIVDLVKAGYGRQIVVGHDIFSKTRLNTYGGHGYAHILENVGTWMTDILLVAVLVVSSLMA